LIGNESSDKSGFKITPLHSDSYISFRVKLSLILIALALIMMGVFGYFELELPIVSGVAGVLLFNLILLTIIANYSVGYILFPFANGLMKYQYHMSFNERMIKEMSKNFK